MALHFHPHLWYNGANDHFAERKTEPWRLSLIHILTQTTTIGVRKYPVTRTVMERSFKAVDTPYGPAQVKVCGFKGKTFFYPEYEDVRRICLEHEMCIRDRDRIVHAILPAATLSITGISNIAMHTRGKMAQVMDSDYMLFARARGDSKWSMVRRHGVRNILLPAMTLQFASVSEIFGGSVQMCIRDRVSSPASLGASVSLSHSNSVMAVLSAMALSRYVFNSSYCLFIL